MMIFFGAMAAQEDCNQSKEGVYLGLGFLSVTSGWELLLHPMHALLRTTRVVE